MSATAFDNAALSYDTEFTNQRLGRWLRERVWTVMEDLFDAESRVLELGCGTGEDARWLGQRGATVVALDASRSMIQIARAKALAHQVADRVSFLHVDLNRLHPETFEPASFDGALSNFGALNCVRDHQALAASLGAWLRPGAVFVAVVMGPVCPWETATHLVRGQWGPLVRRWRQGSTATVRGGTTQVWYPRGSVVRSNFGPWFEVIHRTGLGVLVPPTPLAHWVERWPRPFELAARLEQRLASKPGVRALGDHTLWVMRRRVS